MKYTDSQPVGMRIVRGFAIEEHGMLETPWDPTLQVYYSPAIEARYGLDHENRENRGIEACETCLRWKCVCGRKGLPKLNPGTVWFLPGSVVDTRSVPEWAWAECRVYERRVAGTIDDGLCGKCAVLTAIEARKREWQLSERERKMSERKARKRATEVRKRASGEF